MVEVTGGIEKGTPSPSLAYEGLDRSVLLEAKPQVLREIASRDLLRFLDYVRIPDPPPVGSGSIDFKRWEHIIKLHEAVESVPRGGTLPHLKARKLGVTSYFEARFLWSAMFRAGAFLPVISQGEVEAHKIIKDCRFIWEHLPDYLRGELLADNASTLSFKDGGTIQAFPATSKAGRSYTGTEVLIDEADFHSEFESSYNALLPLIQDSGGKMFIVSTANPDVVDSPFRQLYQGAGNRLFLGYFERPNRDEETYAQALALSSDAARFEKENPLNEHEALAPPRTRAFFNIGVLQEMLDPKFGNAADPRDHIRGLLSVWQYPITAGKYVIGVDTAWGKTGSYNCGTVLDWHTGTQVAELHGRLHPDEMAQEIISLHKMYNHAYLGLERAGEGQERDGDSVVVVDKVELMLQECSCRNRLYYHNRNSTHPSIAGWQTNGRTRPVMLAELAEAIRNGEIVIRCREGIGEMLSFIRNEQGRPQASKGAYDDRVMAYALAWQMRKYAGGSFTSSSRTRNVVVPSVF